MQSFIFICMQSILHIHFSSAPSLNKLSMVYHFVLNLQVKNQQFKYTVHRKKWLAWFHACYFSLQNHAKIWRKVSHANIMQIFSHDICMKFVQFTCVLFSRMFYMRLCICFKFSIQLLVWNLCQNCMDFPHEIHACYF